MDRPGSRLHSVLLVVCVLAQIGGCRDAMDEHPRPISFPASGRLVLNGVTIVDTLDGSLTPEMSIVAEAGKIIRIAATGSLAPDPSAQSIDATGQFVVPGYLDMHVHALGEGDPTDALALMLANGITGFRQMRGTAELLARRRAGTLAQTLDEPALLALPGEVLTPFNTGDPTQAAEVVRAQQEQGADFIKVALATSDVFSALLAEARRIGIPLAGHVPFDVDVVSASDQGIKSIEHLGPANGILVACSTDEASLRQSAPRLPSLLMEPPFAIPFADALTRYLLDDVIINPAAQTNAVELARIRRMLDTYSEEKCREIAARFVANGTWQVPTLIRIRSSQLAFEPEFRNDPDLRYVGASTRDSWERVTQKFEAKLSSKDRQILRDAYALDLELVHVLDAEGVKMLAGSDAVGAGWLVPGFSLHHEFDELAKAELSPLRVLQMATIRGAEFLGQTSSLGRVEAGKNADLVLLDANPIESVQNLHRIRAVVRAGFHRDRTYLDALMKQVESRAAASSND